MCKVQTKWYMVGQLYLDQSSFTVGQLYLAEICSNSCLTMNDKILYNFFYFNIATELMRLEFVTKLRDSTCYNINETQSVTIL